LRGGKKKPNKKIKKTEVLILGRRGEAQLRGKEGETNSQGNESQRKVEGTTKGGGLPGQIREKKGRTLKKRHPRGKKCQGINCGGTKDKKKRIQDFKKLNKPTKRKWERVQN